jgi:hypothetical protein
MGVGFYFDEPGARAAAGAAGRASAAGGAVVARRPVDIVSEIADLAPIRAVGPEEMPWVGRIGRSLW